MLAVAFLSATLSVLPSALAQRVGSAGGHGGGIAGGNMGHMGGSFGGSIGRAPGFASRGFTAPNFVSTAPTHAFSTAPGRAFGPSYRTPYVAPSPAWRDGRGDRGRDRYRSPYRGYGYGYGGYPYAYANSWELLPWDVSSSDFIGSGDDSESEVQQQPAASVVPQDEGYRPEYEAPPEEPPYAYPPAPPQDQPGLSSVAQSSVAPEPALTLIFNDGHQQTIHNYVLTSEAVIVLDQAASGREKRIPLASLNLDATMQAAQQAGLDFTPPTQ
jgi:hypothetical protein